MYDKSLKFPKPARNQSIILYNIHIIYGARGILVAKALNYKSESR
jgi:hypothetical protein